MTDQNTAPDVEDIDAPDEFEAMMNDLLDKMPEDEDDTAGLDSTAEKDPKADPVVKVEDGMTIAEATPASDDPAGKAPPPDKQADKATDETPAVRATDDDTDPKGEDGKTADTPTLANAPVSDLLEGLPEDRAGEVSRRLQEYESAMAPFRTKYAEEALREMGASPADAVSRLVDIYRYADESPEDYLAWFAKERGGEEPAKALIAAGEKLGIKLAAAESSDDDDDDDFFKDDRTRQLEARIAELEAAQGPAGPILGPDTPERQAAAKIERWMYATDKDGQPKLKNLDVLAPTIIERARAEVEKTGHAVSIERLQALYDEEESKLSGRFGGTSAAQTGQTVQDDDKTAANIEKSRRASKSVDGAGQGASRRPALPEDMPLDDLIGKLLDEQLDR